MKYTAGQYTVGIDVGSTYTKGLLLNKDHEIIARSATPTGFKLTQVAEKVYQGVLDQAQLTDSDISYVIATGIGRHQVTLSDVQVTDLTASAWGANHLFPNTRTILDIGGQTMKASCLSDDVKVKSFRLNDKCAAGTGAFIEKTARYMGYETEEIGPLAATSNVSIPISGVCAVFAESEVINQLSEGSAPADIMHGSMVSLVGRAVQLLRRARGEPEFTMAGGILRYEVMIDIITEKLGTKINVPPDDMVQYMGALGASILGHRRLRKLRNEGIDFRRSTEIEPSNSFNPAN